MKEQSKGEEYTAFLSACSWVHDDVLDCIRATEKLTVKFRAGKVKNQVLTSQKAGHANDCSTVEAKDP
jgi:hypothetical protein